MSRLRQTMKPMSLSIVGLAPMLLGVILALIMLLPLGTGADSSAMPHFVMITVYYWARHRPLQMPTGGAAFLGLILDLWLGTPLGLNILLMVLVRVFVLSQIRHLRGRTALAHWLIFAGLVFVLYSLAWIITSIIAGSLIAFQPLVTQYITTLIAYPLLTLLYSALRTRME